MKTQALVALLLVLAGVVCTHGSESYDYIVVGGGSAGCVNALKLSQHGSVLLLERGSRIPDGDINSKILALLLNNWQAPYARDNLLRKDSLGNRRNILVGDTLGGGGMINGAISHMGSRAYWESWGFSKWNYNQHVIPAFNRLKQRLHLMNTPYIPDISRRFVSSGSSISFVNNDLNNPLGTPTEGFGNISVTLKPSATLGYERDTTLFAYLDTATDDLEVSLNSHAVQVEIDNHDRARRVRYIKNGEEFTARARKGIILSAGALGSAHLLMNSGIGPCSHLESVGISCVQNLPVGQNFRDHHSIALSYTTSCLVPTADQPLLAFSPGTQVAGFIKSSPARPYPDIQYTFIPTYGPTAPIFGYTVFLVDPDTRGNVTLAANDPLKPPLINYEYTGSENDAQRLANAITTAEGFMATPPFAECLGTRVSPAPGTDLLSWVKSASDSGYHPTGTNLIGQVVDQNLKVIGIDRLFVLDASIIPLPNGNTQIPTLIAAERGTELIIQATN